ncbi:hypothetical protein Cpir12675_005367 [Ceratocystis pirilliformis]|uniref:Uncharacterized protein n=1 Tax=Ceratocystis pirilliformis TaxID=259994 RepID=A0ABR3YRE7_9PEZI
MATGSDTVVPVPGVAALSAHAAPQEPTLPANLAEAPSSQVGDGETSGPVITPAPELELPANLRDIEFFELPYNKDLINKKLEEVSEGRTSFAAFEFFAAAAATAQASSSSSSPIIATPAAINALPVITGAPQTSNNAVAVNPKIDLSDNLRAIPEFEVPYDLSLLDNVKTPQDLANLPDAIVFATEQPQASTTLRTVIRTMSRDPLEIGI